MEKAYREDKKLPSAYQPVFRQLIARLLSQLQTAQTIELRNTDSYPWEVQLGPWTVTLNLDDDVHPQHLVGSVPLKSLKGDSLPSLQDLSEVNFSLFTTFPACITVMPDTDEIRLLWKMDLNKGLDTQALSKHLYHIECIANALVLRWMGGQYSAQEALKTLH